MRVVRLLLPVFRNEPDAEKHGGLLGDTELVSSGAWCHSVQTRRDPTLPGPGDSPVVCVPTLHSSEVDSALAPRAELGMFRTPDRLPTTAQSKLPGSEVKHKLAPPQGWCCNHQFTHISDRFPSSYS